MNLKRRLSQIHGRLTGQKQYIPFLKYNIEKGWNNRDKKRNICKGRYGEKVTSNDTIDVGIHYYFILFRHLEE